MLILSNVLSDAESCSSVPGVTSLMLGIHAQVFFRQLGNHFMHGHFHGIPRTFVASVFAILSANPSELFNKLPEVAQIPRLLFSTQMFIEEIPSLQAVPLLSWCFKWNEDSPPVGTLIWAGKRMFFLRALQFPKAAGWVCLFAQHFKACPVPWLLSFGAALVPDKSVEENPPEHGLLQLQQRSGQTPQPPKARPRSAEMLKFVPSWQRSGRANLVGEGSWQSSVCKDFGTVWFLSEMTTKGEHAKGAPKASFVCCLSPLSPTSWREFP